MSQTLKAWQCIGCGKIEAPQTCVGVCQDRRVEFVYAAEHQETLLQLERERALAARLVALIRQLAYTTPHQDEWQRSYQVLQARARQILAAQS